MFAYYRAVIDPEAQLLLVGSYAAGRRRVADFDTEMIAQRTREVLGV
jgi:hypothetical protein